MAGRISLSAQWSMRVHLKTKWTCNVSVISLMQMNYKRPVFGLKPIQFVCLKIRWKEKREKEFQAEKVHPNRRRSSCLWAMKICTQSWTPYRSLKGAVSFSGKSTSQASIWPSSTVPTCRSPMGQLSPAFRLYLKMKFVFLVTIST